MEEFGKKKKRGKKNIKFIIDDDIIVNNNNNNGSNNNNNNNNNDDRYCCSSLYRDNCQGISKKKEDEDDDDDDNLYTFDELLKLVLKYLPSECEKKKLKITPARILYTNKRSTIITNFTKICWDIGAQPHHLIKFFIHHLDCFKINLHSEKELIISKRIDDNRIQNTIKRYMKYFKKCSTCEKYETTFVKEKRIQYIYCLLCHAKQSCPSFDDCLTSVVFA